jgi:Photosynthesis system II assembly factor YCF48/Putative zinc-finger
MSDVPARLVRDTLRAAMDPAASSGCIDTETLAAWADGTLNARERRSIESHASACAHCQALLAATARIETAVSAAVPSARWQSSFLNWLVPLAAATAAVTFWIAVPPSDLKESAPLRRDAPASPPAPTAELGRVSKNEAIGLAPSEAAKQRSVAPANPRLPPTTVAGNAVAPIPPKPSAPPPLTDQPRSEDKRNAGELQASSKVVTAPTGAPAARQMRVDQEPQRFAESRAVGVMKSAVAADRLSVAPATEIPSPDRTVRWRVVAANRVERSIDGGTTWQVQPTGTTAAIIAGVAPTPTICWLVGRGGLVLVSTNGQTWQRVPFPEVVDLISIRAPDGGNATVTAADGRSFATTDGGQTWRALPIR